MKNCRGVVPTDVHHQPRQCLPAQRRGGRHCRLNFSDRRRSDDHGVGGGQSGNHQDVGIFFTQHRGPARNVGGDLSARAGSGVRRRGRVGAGVRQSASGSHRLYRFASHRQRDHARCVGEPDAGNVGTGRKVTRHREWFGFDSGSRALDRPRQGIQRRSGLRGTGLRARPSRAHRRIRCVRRGCIPAHVSGPGQRSELHQYRLRSSCEPRPRIAGRCH